MFSPCRKLRLAPLLLYCIALSLVACGGGERTPSSSNAGQSGLSATSDLQAGVKSPTPISDKAGSEVIAAGEKLYSAYNCNGCHSAGGGGMGPPLMDEEWIYGGEPDQIVATLIQGRPNGMPSFRDKIPEAQMRELAAYVRNLSEQAKSNASPGQR